MSGVRGPGSGSRCPGASALWVPLLSGYTCLCVFSELNPAGFKKAAALSRAPPVFLSGISGSREITELCLGLGGPQGSHWGSLATSLGSSRPANDERGRLEPAGSVRKPAKNIFWLIAKKCIFGKHCYPSMHAIIAGQESIGQHGPCYHQL